MPVWALQDAKARLSELVRAAEKEPQTITLRGEEKVVLLSMDEYRKLRRQKPARSLYEIWASAPKVPEFRVSKRRGRMRKVEL